jgi:RHH-type rel operon transcriptional repressor/antitoxin RelB
MLSLRLPDELEARLEKLAISTHRTKSFYARQAIELHIEDLEDLFLAEKAYGDYKAGKVSARPIDDVAQEYGQ